MVSSSDVVEPGRTIPDGIDSGRAGGSDGVTCNAAAEFRCGKFDPGPVQPINRGYRADAGHHHIGLDPGAVGEQHTGHSDVAE